MSKKILIDASNANETRIAVTENGKLDDFEVESNKKHAVKGDVYLAKITRVEPSLQAAFVDFGSNRNGFLPLTEIHPDYFKIPSADESKLKELIEKHAKGRDVYPPLYSPFEISPHLSIKGGAPPTINFDKTLIAFDKRR